MDMHLNWACRLGNAAVSMAGLWLSAARAEVVVARHLT